jgi:phosphomannomutase
MTAKISSKSVERFLKNREVRFGTSGIRGLASNLTDRLCYAFTCAFIHHLENLGELRRGDQVSVGGDLRPSTGRIIRAVLQAIGDCGMKFHYSGRLPSPALCYFGMKHGLPTIMITGSHIPSDRNGIKFTRRKGEITKADEAAILSQPLDIPSGLFDREENLKTKAKLPAADEQPVVEYLQRYLDFFPEGVFSGLRLGVYQHSSAGREIFPELLRRLGAEVVELGWAKNFIAVDTEALDQRTVEAARDWCRKRKLFALVTADGDADRPLVADENGNWLRGDTAGLLCAIQLGIKALAVPVSCSTAIEKTGFFQKVVRTRIGSPYVIEGMRRLSAPSVGGFEANGGFLIQTPLSRNGRRLEALPTRDAAIVHLALLERAIEKHCLLSELARELPQRVTFSDHLKNFPQEMGRQFVEELTSFGSLNPKVIDENLVRLCGEMVGMDSTDGVRLIFKRGDILHLRPSGNAPEFRCYSEAETEARARRLCRLGLQWVEKWRAQRPPPG